MRAIAYDMRGFFSQVVGTAKAGWEDWQRLSVAIESGTAEPHTLVTVYLILPAEKSESGACYATETGEPILNLREQKLPTATREGLLRAISGCACGEASRLGKKNMLSLPRSLV